MKFYAHSTPSNNKDDWQLLEEHLLAVSQKAASFATDFNAGEWGRIAGLLHDAGKATPAFQQRLEGSCKRVDHSTFGACLASERGGSLGLLLAYALSGHHGGLPDGGGQETQLHFRLQHGRVPKDVQLIPTADCQPELTLPFKLSKNRAGFSLSFFTRMLFSCLVDADFLDTEKFCDPERAGQHPNRGGEDTLCHLQQKFNLQMESIISKAPETPVNRVRQEILSECRQKAELPQQIFSLTVPTGGGKTLSSMAFALDHAVKHGLQRIIYAIPFTSIIEQNAAVFQEILGRENVLEHHCNYREKDEPEEAAYNRQRGLASENWDMPVVVTTNVQFFESLFSNRTSRCRKLHNIARSVIILDEAQAIPTEYLEPCLAALRELTEHYGCTIVLCTATQPALDDRSSLRTALPKITEIVSNPNRIYSRLQRTEVSFIGRKSNDDLADMLTQEDQVLCIVSTKPQARGLFEGLENGGSTFHLSTNMYPRHRQLILKTIQKRLKEERSCRVVSTSLVEAGVDLDFPVVYRTMAGLDSIAQAAGRCNREGKLNALNRLGKVYVFEPETMPRMPWIKRCISRAEETLRALPDRDPLATEVIRCYFELLYDVATPDKKQIMALLNPKLQKELFFPFKEAAREFRFIEEENIGVVIPLEPKVEKLVQELRYSEFPWAILRKLQPYSVSVRNNDFTTLATAGAVEMIHDEIPILRNMAAYDNKVGLCVDEGEVWNPAGLIT